MPEPARRSCITPSNDALTRSFSPMAAAATSAPRSRERENTALIGAPGLIWAPSDAGAAYLFDADPASPDLRQRDRRRARAHCPPRATPSARRLGLTTRPWSWARPGPSVRQSRAPRASTSIRRQLLPQSRVSSATTYATSGAYDSVIVSGTFMDANPHAAVTASINWGDGYAPTICTLPVGSYAFSAPHDY